MSFFCCIGYGETSKVESKKPGFFALYTWGEELVRYSDEIVKIGIKWVRLGGRQIPTKEHDEAILEGAKKGIHCVPVISDKEAASKNDMKKWRETVRSVIKRYGPNGSLWKENPSVKALPIEYVEIWNEPNIEFLEPPEGMLRDELYFNLLKNAYEEIKFLNKDIKVVGFNTAGGVIIKDSGPPIDGMFQKLKYFGWLKMIKDVHKRGGGKFYDILGVHPYTTPYPPERRKLVESIEVMRKEMREKSDGEKPIWFTEVGYPLVYPNNRNVKNEDEQADFLLRLFGLGTSHGIEQIQVMYIVDIIYGPDKSQRSFGFFDGNRWRKQAIATKVMIDLLGDPPQLVSTISDGNEKFYAYEFKGRSGKNVIMTWLDNDEPEERGINVGGIDSVTLVDKLGNKQTLSVKDGKIKIKIGGSPIFIEK